MKMSFRDFNEQFAEKTDWQKIKRARREAGQCWQCCAPCRDGKCPECGANNKPVVLQGLPIPEMLCADG